MTSVPVFVSGGTGYLGRPLLDALLAGGHSVLALVRTGSQHSLPGRVTPVIGDALDADSFASAVPANATTQKPSPAARASVFTSVIVELPRPLFREPPREKRMTT